MTAMVRTTTPLAPPIMGPTGAIGAPALGGEEGVILCSELVDAVVELDRVVEGEMVNASAINVNSCSGYD